MESLHVFVTGFLLSLSLCLDLGVVNVALLQTGLRHGVRPAFMVGLGSCFGDLTYAVISMVAISLILGSPAVRWGLWIIGTAVLVALTVHMLREAFSREMKWTEGDPAPMSDVKEFARGYALAVASPSAILWFATVGGSLIATTASGRGALLPFFIGFFTCGLVWSLALAVAAGRGRKLMGAKLLRGFCAASAVLFAYFAVKVFWTGWVELGRG